MNPSTGSRIPAAAAPPPPWGAARWQLRLLGAVEASDARQRTYRLPSRAVARLLARLALAPQRAHAREELVELLWPGVGLDVGRNRLRQALSALRSLLEPAGSGPAAVLMADRQVVRIATGALDCDVHRFEHCARSGHLEEALRWYQGELMPGFYDDWVQAERLRLASIHDRLATVRPAGWSTPAPPATRPDSHASSSARVETLAAAPSGPPLHVDLPHYLTPLFGAESTTAELEAEVLSQRLLTVTGPGGAGKTRLAVEVARAVAPARFDLVAFVPLAACQSRQQLAGELLARLRAAGPGTAADQLETALRGRRTLLVLDNFEQLVDAAAGLVSELLARLPALHLLVTSRRRLGIDGERLFEMTGLPLPALDAGLEEAAASPALALFVNRARAVRSDFRLGPRNRATLVALVQSLEGLPLALELAASRIRGVGPEQMLALLARPDGGARLGLLARSGPRAGLDARQASMQRVIEWSWNLLDAGPRDLLEALAVFRGGCTAAAAGAVVGNAAAVPLRLDELVGQSLLQSRADASGGLRFWLYEPVREFALARNDVEPTSQAARAAYWRARHRQWLLDWARALPATPSLPEVREELGNIAAALGSAAAAGDAAMVVKLLTALRRVLEDVSLPPDALQHAARALDACADPALAAQARTVLAPALLRAGHAEDACRQAEQALADTAAGLPRAAALHALARVLWRSTRDAARVLPLLDEADTLAAAGEGAELPAALAALRGFVTNVQLRDPQAAHLLHERALVLWQRAGNRHAVHSGLYNLAVTEQNAGRHRDALVRLAGLIDSARELQDWRRVSEALNVAGNAHAGLRQWAPSAQDHAEALRVAWRHATPYEMAYPLWNLPRSLAHLGRPLAAVRLASFAARYWTEGFGPLGPRDRHDLRRVRRLASVQAGALRVDAAWQEGKALSLADACALAWHEVAGATPRSRGEATAG